MQRMNLCLRYCSFVHIPDRVLALIRMPYILDQFVPLRRVYNR